MKKTEHLPFFGIGKVLPYLKNYKMPMAIMILGSVNSQCAAMPAQRPPIV